jgi:hypothetical protein
MRGIRGIATAGGAVALAAALLAAGPMGAGPAAAMTAQEAEAMVADRYEVEVLKVEPGRVDGRSVWMVTVMEPGGQSNSAFRVARLAIDRSSGDLVPAFRHDSSGYDVPESGGRFTRDIVAPDRAAGTVWR